MINSSIWYVLRLMWHIHVTERNKMKFSNTDAYQISSLIMQHWHWVYHKGEIKCPQRWEYKFEHVALQLVLFSSIFPYKNYFNDMSYFGVIPITFLLKSYTTIFQNK